MASVNGDMPIFLDDSFIINAGYFTVSAYDFGISSLKGYSFIVSQVYQKVPILNFFFVTQQPNDKPNTLNVYVRKSDGTNPDEGETIRVLIIGVKANI